MHGYACRYEWNLLDGSRRCALRLKKRCLEGGMARRAINGQQCLLLSVDRAPYHPALAEHLSSLSPERMLSFCWIFQYLIGSVHLLEFLWITALRPGWCFKAFAFGRPSWCRSGWHSSQLPRSCRIEFFGAASRKIAEGHDSDHEKSLLKSTWRLLFPRGCFFERWSLG